MINNNNSLGQILWEQMVLGYPEYGVRHPDPFADYTAIATANGALGLKVTHPSEVRSASSTVSPNASRPAVSRISGAKTSPRRSDRPTATLNAS